MKLLKTLLKENNLKKETDYYDLILNHYFKGNHFKAADLFQDLKKDQKDQFLCNYLAPEPFAKVIKFFIRELLI
jgi:hypothetical protein